jgi:hypothetical protein
MYDIWTLYVLLLPNTDPACAAIKVLTNADKNTHGFSASPGQTSDHTLGIAFNANVTVPSGSGYTIDSLAGVYHYIRNVPGDVVHFKYVP